MYHVYVLTFEEQAKLKMGERCEIVPGAHAIQFETRETRHRTPVANGAAATPAAEDIKPVGHSGWFKLTPKQREEKRAYQRQYYYRKKREAEGKTGPRYILKGGRYVCTICKYTTDTIPQMKGHLSQHPVEKGTPS